MRWGKPVTLRLALKALYRQICTLGLLAGLVSWPLFGCGQPSGSGQRQAGSAQLSLPPPPPPAAAAKGAAQKQPAMPALPPPPTTAAKKQQPKGPILKRTTQEIREARKEVAKGARRVQPQIQASEPITLAGSAYAHIISRATQLKIKHAVDLFHAEHGRYPKDFDEFYTKIIRANNIRLPALPAYQKYGYDEQKHELVILEYPDIKRKMLGQ